MKVFLRSAVAKYLERLGVPDKNRIKAALENLEKEPPEGDIKPIAERKGYFRLRVGNLRALYRIEENAILVMSIDPRGQAYKKENRRKK